VAGPPHGHGVALGTARLSGKPVPQLLVEATDLVALGDGGRNNDAREPIRHHFVRLPRKRATAIVERAVLTRVGNIEEGESGPELGEQKPRPNLIEAASQLRSYRELIRAIRHGMWSAG